MHGCIAKIAIDTIPSLFAIIESNNNISDSILSDSERSRTMRVNREQLYTESLGCNIASDSASFESCQSQIHANQYVFQQHYPKFLVNYPFVPLTVNLDMRITTRIGSLERIKNESRKPNESGTNREMRTNQERIRKTERIMNCDIFATDPPQWKLRVYPPQWKLRVDPYSGNMVLIRQTPAVEIRKGDPTDGKA